MQDYKVISKFNEGGKLISVKAFSEYVGIGIHKSYEILNREDAPVIRVGKRMYVVKERVDDWLDTLIGCQF